MIAKRHLCTSIVLLVFMFGALIGITSSADAQKVHALLIILGNDRNIRDSVNVNEGNMQTLLRLLSENCEVHITVMKSENETTGAVTEKILANADVTSQNSLRQLGIIKANQVTSWIRNLQPSSNDTILIYYSGHGMINEDGIHILNFDPNVTNDFVTRDRLRERLQQKSGRLKMLITDTCSNQGQGSDLIAQSYGRVVPRKRRYTEDLFLKHKGFLDITAASPGQYAWGNDQIGGYFTAALIESFTAESDTNEDRFLSWEEIFLATRDETQKLFSEMTLRPSIRHNQKTQTPTKYSLPRRLTHPSAAVLTVSSDPSGASVYIDDVKIGKTPLENYEVDIGISGEKQAKMLMELEGYRSMNLTIKGSTNRETGLSTLKAGETYTWQNIYLEKLATIATLTVSTDPSGASVYVDDIWVGNTPFEDRKVDIGASGSKQVNIRLKREGYKSKNLWVKENHNKETGLSILKAGETYTWQNVHLEKLGTTQIDRREKDGTDYTIKNIALAFAGDRSLSSIGGFTEIFIAFIIFGLWWLLFGGLLWPFLEDSNFIKHYSIAPKIYPWIIFFLCITNIFVYHFTFSLEVWVKFYISGVLGIITGCASFPIILLSTASGSLTGGSSLIIGVIACPTFMFLTLIIPDDTFLKFYELLVRLHIFPI